MIRIILFFALLLVWCLFFALLEVQIEGNKDWANGLPTKRYHRDGKKIFRRKLGAKEWEEISRNSWLGRFMNLYILYLGGKDFTIYHRVVDLMQFFVAHLSVYFCFSGADSYLVLEIRALITLTFIWMFEGALYWLVNPFFGFKKFKEWCNEKIQLGGVVVGNKGMMLFLIPALMALSFYLPRIWHN